jgi:hypothetical protein
MTRAWLRGVGVACVGVGFAALAVLVYLIPITSDLYRGSAVLFTATKTGVTWSHSYDLRNHPVYFCMKVLTDFSGVISFGGLGVLLLSAAARSVLDPSGVRVSARAKARGTAWAFTCIAAMVLHFGLLLFPYLLKYGILS